MPLVYLIHFDVVYRPYPDAPAYKCAGHYTGVSPVRGVKALMARLAKHGTPEGAKLMLAVANAGITWQLARVWQGGRRRERQLKRQGGAKRRCPMCGVKPRFRKADLPRCANGAISRSLTTDDQKARAGIMTTMDRKAHNSLRHGAVTGKVPGRECKLDRVPKVPLDDGWYTIPQDVMVHH